MARHTPKFYPGRRQLLLLALMVAAVYVLLPQIGDFRSSWRLLGGASPGFAAAAIALTFVTFTAAAGTYCFLAFRPLPYGRTLLVQLAANFVNRLLPAGIGAIGANYLYLRHQRHSAAQAGSIVAINNLLGLIGHVLLVSISLLVFSGRGAVLPSAWHGPGLSLFLKASVAVIAALLLLAWVFGRRRVEEALADIKNQLASYGHRPWSLLAAQATSITLTVCNVLCLFLCVHALHLQLPFIVVLIVFTLGLGVGSAVPTPGGLGGFEAGLTAGFVAYGVDPAPALSVALLYRLISYWLPMAGGGAAFVACQHKKLFHTRTV